MTGPGPDRAAQARMFWRYWTASTVSNVGTGVTAVALPLVAVSTLQASSFEVSLVVAATYAAWVLIGLPAGVLVSRLPMRETQVLLDLTRAAALATVPVAGVLGVLTLAQLVAVAFLVGLCTVVFDVANSSFVVSIVSREQLVGRNSLLTASSSVTQLAGPSLGGLLVQLVGAATCIVADVVSYVVSAVLLGSLPRAERPPPRSADEPALRRQIADGLAFVARHEVMRPCTVNVTIINAACGAFLALTPLFLVRTLSAGPALVGLLFATEGVGSLAGAAVTPRVGRRLGSAGALRAAGVAAALSCFLMPLAPRAPVGYVLFALGNAGFAGAVVVVSVMSRTHRQAVTPPELLPRVMATVRFVSWGVAPFGAAAAGALAGLVGIRAAFLLACCVVLVAPLSLLASPVWTLRDLDEPESRAMAAEAGHREQTRREG